MGWKQPDITFFGQMLPDTFHKRLLDHDREEVDLLICIGTSLKVAPVSEIIGFLPADVPQIYISKTVSFSSPPCLRQKGLAIVHLNLVEWFPWSPVKRNEFADTYCFTARESH